MTEEEFDDLKAEVKYLKKKSGKARAEAREAEEKLKEESNRRFRERVSRINNLELAAERAERRERDAEIRKILLPLTEGLMKTGWRIAHGGGAPDSKGRIPVFIIFKAGADPKDRIGIHWVNGFTQSGFEWQ